MSKDDMVGTAQAMMVELGKVRASEKSLTKQGTIPLADALVIATKGNDRIRSPKMMFNWHHPVFAENAAAAVQAYEEIAQQGSTMMQPFLANGRAFRANIEAAYNAMHEVEKIFSDRGLFLDKSVEVRTYLQELDVFMELAADFLGIQRKCSPSVGM